MSVISPTTNYVKFIRGTPIAFANLTPKDPDTLYFICATDANHGLLYLGDKLIGDGSSTTQTDFGNVVITAIGDKQIIAYDENSDTWVNVDATSIIDIMRGATSTTAGAKGLVPVPSAGDQNKFLRGDGTWSEALAGISSFDSNLFETTSAGKITLKDFQTASANTVLQKTAGGSIQWVTPASLVSDLTTQVNNLQTTVDGLTGVIKRAIVPTVEDINVNASNAEQYIYMVPNGNTAGNLYDEYMVVNHRVEKIGNGLSGNIEGYVLTSTFENAITNINNEFDRYVTLFQYNQEVGNLQALIKSQSNGDTLVDQVNDITLRLAWQQIIDS